jgi:transposase
MGYTSFFEITREGVYVSWKEEDPVGERTSFVDAYLSKRYRMSELCAVFGVSIKTGYKTINRFSEDGVAGLSNRSRASHEHANATPPEIARLVIDTRLDHPRWGPLKVLQYLEAKYPALTMPATSTAGAILAERGWSGDGRIVVPQSTLSSRRSARSPIRIKSTTSTSKGTSAPATESGVTHSP